MVIGKTRKVTSWWKKKDLSLVFGSLGKILQFIAYLAKLLHGDVRTFLLGKDIGSLGENREVQNPLG